MGKLSEEKIETIINTHYKFLFKIAYNYTLNEYDSEDIVQDVFFKLYNSHNTFNDDEHIKRWLIRVTINLSLNLLKHKKRTVIVDSNDLDHIASSDEDNSNMIYECICLLKEPYKNIIILFYYDELSVKDISEILNIGETNVTSRLNRARMKLKKIIQRREENGK